MGKLSIANMKKTVYYLQRNGLQNTFYAAMERLQKKEDYVYAEPKKGTLQMQREASGKMIAEEGISFSIVVPTYRTDPIYLKELVGSVCNQTYCEWELILADATEDESVQKYVEELCTFWPEHQGKIRYVKLSGNKGISENTNEALSYVTKEYVGLLDHDDILTKDALYEMANAIGKARKQGQELAFVYSDEDKCNSDATLFYEPHRKEDFNLDLILSNNYICHFLVMKKELIQTLRFRAEYDGAQDYDLVLRAVLALGILQNKAQENQVCHIPKVLYHWRCHEGSTASNPLSKTYAYEAGKKALQDFMDRSGIVGQVKALKHVGFYEVDCGRELLKQRKDLGAVGGPVYQRNRIVGGRMDATGQVFYLNLPKNFSGYMNRAVLTQSAEALDLRNIQVRKELWDVFEKVVGVPYVCVPGGHAFDCSILPKDADYVGLSLALSQAISEQGYRMQWRREYE